MRIEKLPSAPGVGQGGQEFAGLSVGEVGLSAGIVGPVGSSGASSASFRGEFASRFKQAVSEIEGKMRVAEIERQRVFAGDVNSLHQATIAASEAGVAFSLMVEVRNKLVESYQELMRMQV